MIVSVPQIRAARALLGWKQSVLDYQASAPWPATSYIERGEDKYAAHQPALVSALEKAGIRFVPNGVVLERSA